MRERRKLQEKKNEPELLVDYPVFMNINEAVASTLCEKLEIDDTHQITCLNRKCQACGIHEFKLPNDENGDDLVNWERFEYVTISCKGRQERKKLMLVKKQSAIKDLFSYFLDLMSSFPAHQFQANWQRQQLRHLRTYLPGYECAVIHDFSENYRIAGKDELQSYYFQRTEVTLHVSILYRHAMLEVDGKDSIPENPQIITEQFLVFSSDEKHDHHFVHKVQEQIRDYLTAISYRVTTMHAFTDGCQAQYKSRHCMGDVSYSCGDLGYQKVIRIFFETAHANGPQDAAGGYVKRQLDLAILRGNVIINTAEDAYVYARDNLATVRDVSTCSRSIFRYVETSDVDRDRNRYFKPVLNNRDVHQVITTGEGVFTLRSYTCSSCAVGLFENCKNKPITSPRTNVRLDKIHSGPVRSSA